MTKKATYRKVLFFNWLFALSFGCSLVALSGFVSTAEACRSQPQRIEVVASGQDDTENSVSPYRISALEFSSSSLKRAREYELIIRVVYQRQIKDTFDTILERTHSYSPPDIYWIARVISSLSDDAPSLTLS